MNLHQFRQTIASLHDRTMGIQYLLIHGGLKSEDLRGEMVRELKRLREEIEGCLRWLRERDD